MCTRKALIVRIKFLKSLRILSLPGFRYCTWVIIMYSELKVNLIFPLDNDIIQCSSIAYSLDLLNGTKYNTLVFLGVNVSETLFKIKIEIWQLHSWETHCKIIFKNLFNICFLMLLLYKKWANYWIKCVIFS